MVGPSHPTVGSRYNYQCNAGFVLKGNTSSYVECSAETAWVWENGNKPECVPGQYRFSLFSAIAKLVLVIDLLKKITIKVVNLEIRQVKSLLILKILLPK